MTREEAIINLYTISVAFIDPVTKEQIEIIDETFRVAIEALEQEPKWIPVSERLPENSGNYLITYCYQDEIETQEAVYVEGEEDKWYDITDIEITLAVIAWMPLPEPMRMEKPYKAESEDKE